MLEYARRVRERKGVVLSDEPDDLATSPSPGPGQRAAQPRATRARKAGDSRAAW